MVTVEYGPPTVLFFTFRSRISNFAEFLCLIPPFGKKNRPGTKQMITRTPVDLATPKLGSADGQQTDMTSVHEVGHSWVTMHEDMIN